jgi:outer membrane protein assembly factor BamB
VITRIDDEPEEKVFIGAFCNMCCLDLASGQVDWSFHACGEITKMPSVCRLGVIFGDTYGKSVYSLDRQSGDLQWKMPTSGRVTSLFVVDESIVLVADDDNHLYCFEARLGRCEWKREFTPYNITRMNVLDHYLLLTSRYKDVYCFKMIADEPSV